MVAQWQTSHNTSFFGCPLLVGLQTLPIGVDWEARAGLGLLDLTEQQLLLHSALEKGGAHGDGPAVLHPQPLRVAFLRLPGGVLHVSFHCEEPQVSTGREPQLAIRDTEVRSA